MIIEKEIKFEMGHRIPNHNGKCKNLHGHSYHMVVGIGGEIKPSFGKNQTDEGMVMDFGDLKEIINDTIYTPLDHSFMAWKEDYQFLETIQQGSLTNMKIVTVSFVPTAENIANWCLDKLSDKINKRGVFVEYVKLWETDTSCAIANRNLLL